MKKILLIAIASAVMASSAYAAGKPMVMKNNFSEASKWKLVQEDNSPIAASVTERSSILKKGPVKAPTADGRPGTLIGRPAGSFYMGSAIGGGGYAWNMTMIYMAPFVDQTFKNMATEAESYKWMYWGPEDYEVEDGVPTQESTDQDLTLVFDGGFQYGPELTATNSVGDSTYVIDYIQAGGDVFDYEGVKYGACNVDWMWPDGNGDRRRSYYNPSQTGSFSAETNSYHLEDFKQYGVDTLQIKGFAEFFAKPAMPYMLTQVYTLIDVCDAKPGVATLQIVKAVEKTANDGTTYFDLSDEVLCTATANYTYEDGHYSQLLFSDLVYTDPEEGLESELIIEDPIFVVITTDHRSICPTWSPHVDAIPEEQAYLVTDLSMEDESVMENYLLDANWRYSVGYANSWNINLDITMNYLWCEEDTFEAPAEGGEKTFNLKSYYSTANWDIVTADGEDIDDLDWLSLELIDSTYVGQSDGETHFTGDVKCIVKVDALPEGVDSRNVDLLFTYPGGAKYVMHITQGESGQVGIKGDVDGSGIVDVDDVNALINLILDYENYKDKYPGVADVDGSGIIDVDDVNAVINIILGV